MLSGVNSLKNLLMSHYLTKGLILNLKNIRRYPPVIIYQMGKVGSTALLESLQTTDIPNMVYSAHFISHKGMDDAEKYFLSQSKPTIPNHLKFRRLLRRKIDKTKGICWKIITKQSNYSHASTRFLFLFVDVIINTSITFFRHIISTEISVCESLF